MCCLYYIKTPHIKQINPEHTVPTLDDNGFIIRESHVINTYLIQKYSRADYLYPQDLQKRTLIDQCLYFDCGVIQPRLMAILVRSIIRFKMQKY